MSKYQIAFTFFEPSAAQVVAEGRTSEEAVQNFLAYHPNIPGLTINAVGELPEEYAGPYMPSQDPLTNLAPASAPVAPTPPPPPPPSPTTAIRPKKERAQILGFPNEPPPVVERGVETITIKVGDPEETI